MATKNELTAAQLLERHKTDIVGYQTLFGGKPDEVKELTPKERLAKQVEQVRAQAAYINGEPGFNHSDVRALAGCIAQLAEAVAQIGNLKVEDGK